VRLPSAYDVHPYYFFIKELQDATCRLIGSLDKEKTEEVVSWREFKGGDADVISAGCKGYTLEYLKAASSSREKYVERGGKKGWGTSSGC